MKIMNISGAVLYCDDNKVLKRSLEAAISKKTPLIQAEFRKKKLRRANLDGMNAAGSSFWLADCESINLAGSNLRHADFRGANLKNACLAECDCQGANFAGAYLSGAILRHCNMQDAFFNCPSLFEAGFDEISSFEGATYSHLGEIDIPLTPLPLVIRGLDKRVVLFDNYLLLGVDLIEKESCNPEFLDHLCQKISA